MQALRREGQHGRIDCLGASDCPAWFVSACNEHVLANNLPPFVIHQGLWNAFSRDFEHEILPVAQPYGIAVVPWSVLGQGMFRTPEQLALREEKFGTPLRGGKGQSEQEKASPWSSTVSPSRPTRPSPKWLSPTSSQKVPTCSPSAVPSCRMSMTASRSSG